MVLAESEGFEPPSPCGLTVFKTAAFDRSANSPVVDCTHARNNTLLQPG
jgi:hypothetical protein